VRATQIILLLLLGTFTSACGRNVHSVSFTPSVKAQETAAVSSSNSKVDFAANVEPILKSKCQPCHFSGGKVYDKLPFDRPETIKTLGTKLFTRIHDENERKIIREFLAQ
jgi:hypothetical protein